MSGWSLMHEWAILMESLATLSITVTALGLMLGIVKPADALKYVGAILGILIVLTLIPRVLANLLSAISVWPWIGLAAIGIGISQWRRPRRQPRKEKEN